VAEDWKALQSDLQQGNLASAQAIFSAMQKDSPTGAQAAEAKPPSADNLIGEALHALQAALQKIDLSGAQSALVALQTAVKTAYAQTNAGGGIPPGEVPDSTSATASEPTTGSKLNLLA